MGGKVAWAKSQNLSTDDSDIISDIGLFDGNFNRIRNNNTSVGINIIYSWCFGYFITIFRRLNLIINIKHDLWEKYTQFIEFLHDEIQNFSKNEQNFYENNFFYLNTMSKILAKMRKLRRSNHTHDLTAYWLTNECRNRSIALIYIGLVVR